MRDGYRPGSGGFSAPPLSFELLILVLIVAYIAWRYS